MYTKNNKTVYKKYDKIQNIRNKFRLILKFITYNVYDDRDQTDVNFLDYLFQNNYIKS